MGLKAKAKKAAMAKARADYYEKPPAREPTLRAKAMKTNFSSGKIGSKYRRPQPGYDRSKYGV